MVALFGLFLTHFDLILKFIFFQNETRIELKMFIFEKLNLTNASTKMIIFHSILLLIFWTHFQAPPKSMFSQPFNMSL
jgi:hypothetical protein